ncbi:protein of unknown function [Taphrina deformans PYCC 5710]|uniref:Uncharacterized protein n=1 Tax=Taphrina deformans (strain PYCC 5710 / ATCC 11124 / CBS 356.35 / IMI 108563 / JCM 9778 / NBRC 8474) TaxID=1097556 RepID=R4XGS3_TAPDE|nr:protein of unknown function [Taphrina deformans PYCC 5710]|eukprot:CCG84869.1 protein of unknown function [Taphrina deformans PYCC 5710]
MTAVLQTLAIVLLPVVIPFARKQFNNVRQYRNAIPRGYTSTERERLSLICVAAAVYLVVLVSELLASETNVYRLTDSRLAIPLDVLRRRAAALGKVLPDSFWTVLENREGVLMYLRLGIEPFLECTWCALESPNSYVLYIVGGIALRYLTHLPVLSLSSGYKVLSAWVLAAAFATEMYVRSGGLDRFNGRTKGSRDILFVDSYAGVVRNCFFLWTLAAASIKCYLDARYPGTQSTPADISLQLVQTIEKLRASNSMQRSVGDNKTLREHAAGFWARNEAATANLDCDQTLKDARTNASSRVGNTKQETAQAREFVERVSAQSM